MQTSNSDADSKKNSATLEEAIVLTGYGKFHRMLLFASTLCLVSLSMEIQSLSYLLPATQCDFQMTSSQKGLLSSVQNIGIIVGCNLWGYLADTRGRKKILLYALLMESTCAVASSFAPNFWTFYVFRFLNGCLMSALSPIMFAYQGEFHAAETRSSSMFLACGLSNIGSLIIPVLAWLIIPQKWVMYLPMFPYKSWRVFVVVCAVPGFVTFIFLKYFFPESPKFFVAVGKETEAIDALRKVFVINSRIHSTDYPVNHITSLDKESKPQSLQTGNVVKKLCYSIAQHTFPLFKSPHVRYSLLLCCLQFGIFFCSNSVFLWIPEMLNRVATYSKIHPESYPTLCEAMSYYEHRTNVSEEVMVNGDLLLSLTTEAGWSEHSTYPTDVEECTVDMDITVFTGTFILSSISAVQYFLLGIIVKHINIKTIMVTCMVISAVFCLCLQFVQSNMAISVLMNLFVTFFGINVNVLNIASVDLFPTHLRAMILSIALMVGRTGAVAGNTLIGYTIDYNCTLMIYLLCGVSLMSGVLTFFIPPSNRRKASEA